MLSQVCQLGKDALQRGNLPVSSKNRSILKTPALTKIQKRLFTDHYTTLGVSPTATQSEIKKAFFEKAKKVHPDTNKSDPNAQKKFVELSAAYEVLKDKNKRSTYDMQRQYGGTSSSSSSSSSYGSNPSGGGSYGGSPFGGGSGDPFGGRNPYGSGNPYAEQTFGGSTGFNPFRNGGGQPYQSNQEEMFRRYEEMFRDLHREFESNATIVKERMPDGTVVTRIIYTGGARGRRPQQQQQQSGMNDREQYRGGPEGPVSDIFKSIFTGGGRGPGLGGMFASLFKDGFKSQTEQEQQQRQQQSSYQQQSSQQQQQQTERSHNRHECFNSYYKWPTYGQLSERWEGAGKTNELVLDFSDSSGYIGTLSERILSGDQGHVLTYTKNQQAIAKARRYLREGKERIIIESGYSRRLAAIERSPTGPPSIAKAASPLQLITETFSMYYKILDESDRPSGYYSVSPWRRKLTFFDTAGNPLTTIVRGDLENMSFQNPTCDSWALEMPDIGLFDPSVYVFSAGFSTLAERRSTSAIPALSNMWSVITSPKK